MRTLVAVIAEVLLGAGLLACPTAATSAARLATDGTPDVYVASTDDIVVTGSPRAHWLPLAAATYDVEVAHAGVTAASLGDWSRSATAGETDGTVALTVDPGEVVCIRVRVHTPTDDAPWGLDCASRTRDDDDFRVVGPHERVRTHFSGGHATSLLRGGELVVPGLRPGMRVAAVYPGWRSLWRDYDIARWQDPNGVEQVSTVGDSTYDAGAEFAVSGTGSGRFFAGRGAGTQPLGGIAVLPAWFPFEDSTFPPDDNATVIDAPRASTWPVTAGRISLNGSLRLSWSPVRATDIDTELQIAAGSVLASRPEWRDRPLPAHASSLRVGVPEGRALCARVRYVRTDGQKSAWSRAACATRPFDDTHVARSGRFTRAPDPSSVDGRSRRMAGGSRMSVRRIRAGSLFGWAYYAEHPRDGGVRPWPELRLNGKGRGSLSGWSWYGVGQGHPSGWWAEVRRSHSVGMISLPHEWHGDSTERIFGLFVIPRWAR